MMKIEGDGARKIRAFLTFPYYRVEKKGGSKPILTLLNSSSFFFSPTRKKIRYGNPDIVLTSFSSPFYLLSFDKLNLRTFFMIIKKKKGENVVMHSS